VALGSFVPAGRGSTPRPAGDLDALRSTIIKGIKDFDANQGRSLQRIIGPSQVGVPCPRALAYMASAVEPLVGNSDPWPAIVGTALHNWCDLAFKGHPEFLTNLSIRVGPMPGKADLYHIPTGTLIDLKFPGNTAFQSYSGHGPEDSYWWSGLGSQYRVQLQCYGAGVQAQGRPVRKVALFVAGKAKPLPTAVMVGWDYDPAVVTWALERRAAAYTLRAAGVDPRAVTATPEPKICYFCEYRGADDRGLCDEGKTS
jgi:hypothetical protein